uniref:ORF23 n=1 Tax=Chlamydomonas reinhardtii TaxID=3055 RepID=Q99197_CHLRE|nr:unnamed protein product [Chlamydomonas reinhardtii]
CGGTRGRCGVRGCLDSAAIRHFIHATHPVLAALSATSATSTRAGWGGHGGLGGVIGSCEAGGRRPLRATNELLGRLRHEWRLLSV